MLDKGINKPVPYEIQIRRMEEGKVIKKYIQQMYGRIPISIWDVDWGVKVIDLTDSTMSIKQRREEQLGIMQKSGYSVSRIENTSRLSRFPHDLCRFCVIYYCPEYTEQSYFNNGLGTVLDPFAGHNSRLQDVWLCHRNYVGWDISQKSIEHNKHVIEILRTQYELFRNDVQVELICGDSREMNYNEQFDFAITSPPFWVTESYGDEPEQIGKGSYNDFLYNLRCVFASVYKALKPDSFFVVETADIRHKGWFYVFHADTINQLIRVGFVVHDIIIANYGSSIGLAFPTQILNLKSVAKVHSYFIVARKGQRYNAIPSKDFREDILTMAQSVTQSACSSQLQLPDF